MTPEQSDSIYRPTPREQRGIAWWQQVAEAKQEERDKALAELAAVKAERDALLRFKQWVHGYLDNKGVPEHPPGSHGAEGCRIGDRMDYVFAKRDRLREALKPFADQAAIIDDPANIAEIGPSASYTAFWFCASIAAITIGDCRRAKEAMG